MPGRVEKHSPLLRGGLVLGGTGAGCYGTVTGVARETRTTILLVQANDSRVDEVRLDLDAARVLRWLLVAAAATADAAEAAAVAA